MLVYAVNSEAPQHEASRAVVEAALAGQLPGMLVPQVLLEFFAVVTNPGRVARPLDPETAWGQVGALRARLPVLEVRPTALDLLGELLSARGARGRAVFDLFLVAQLRAHGVQTICTYNIRDFVRLPWIEAMTPEQVLL